MEWYPSLDLGVVATGRGPSGCPRLWLPTLFLLNCVETIAVHDKTKDHDVNISD